MRKITPAEKAFVSFLMERADHCSDIPSEVRSMNDGGMGSISFDIEGNQRRVKQIAAGTFKDQDGVIADFELTVDENGRLFELDIWKVDFSPLQEFPDPRKTTLTKSDNL